MSPPVGKPRITPVSLVKTMESHEVTFVTTSRQTSYYSSVPRQDYGITRGYICHHQSVNLVLLQCPSSRLWNHTRLHLSPPVGKPRITPVSLVKTMESYKVYENHTSFADWVTIRVVFFVRTDRYGRAL